MEWMIFSGAALLVLVPVLILTRSSDRKEGRKRLRQMKPDEPGNTVRGRKLTPHTNGNIPFLKSLEYLLISAGFNVSATGFFAFPLAAGLIAASALGVAAKSAVLPLGVMALALLLPSGYLFFKKKQLEKAVISEMPEAIGMVARALQIGQTVDRALKDAANALSGPLGTEIKIVYQENAMGLSFEQALKNFKNRYPSLPDVSLFCTAFIIQRETGGNLVDILEGLADTIRKRFSFRQKIKTYSAEARLSAFIIALLPFLFALFALIFNPEYISRLTASPAGRVMVYLAGGFEIAGFIAMYRMTRIRG